VPGAARADMGPILEQPRIVVHVTQQGQPVSQPFHALLLRPEQAGIVPAGVPKDTWADYSSWLKDIDRAALTDPDGTRWVPPWVHGVNSDVRPGTVTFRFRGRSVPERVRVAFYFPDEERIVLTDEAPAQSYLTDLAADLSSGGTATLRPIPKSPVTLVFGILGENLGSLALALLVTVILELLVIAACAWLRPVARVRRLYLAVLLGNLITVPLVWFASVYAKVEPTPLGWGQMFLLAEVCAAVFEGWLYTRLARVPFPKALLWSGLANGLTLLVGCFLVAFTL
jgi:hypothetical protein